MWRIGVLILSLTACDSTTPAVARWERASVSEGGMTFGLHWDRGEGQVEIYRISKHFLPRLSEVMGKATIAVERTTKCRVRPGTMEGDAALLKARIEC